MEKKIIVEKRNNLSRRIIEGVAVGFGIAFGLGLPDLITILILKL